MHTETVGHEEASETTGTSPPTHELIAALDRNTEAVNRLAAVQERQEARVVDTQLRQARNAEHWTTDAIVAWLDGDTKSTTRIGQELDLPVYTVLSRLEEAERAGTVERIAHGGGARWHAVEP